jgi:methionine synthase I (cobalamin-dependent)
MDGNYLFLNNEGSDKLMIVMTYEAMTELQSMLDSIREQWAETDDFAYFALSGGMSQKGEMVDGNTKKD